MKTKTSNQLLIEKFCKKESINWPREMKILAALLKREPIEFWQFLVLGFDLNSLAWFNSKEGKLLIAKNKQLFDVLRVKPTVAFEENFEYVRETEKKQSLKDRLLK